MPEEDIEQLKRDAEQWREYQARRKEYRERPEVKEHERQRKHEYFQLPEVKEHRRQLYKTPEYRESREVNCLSELH
jgi:hypothetical protein